MGMSSPRPKLVDAAKARIRLPPPPPRTREIGTVDRRLHTSLSGMELDNDVSLPEEYRLPSTRPIDRRWDRSRGIIFSHARRPVARDLTWSRGDSICFADPAGAKRGYPSNPLLRKNRPSPAAAEGESDRQGQERDRKERPARGVPASSSPVSSEKAWGKMIQSENVYHRLEQERKDHENTRKRHPEEIEKIRLEKRAEVEKVHRESAAEILRHRQELEARDEALKKREDAVETKSMIAAEQQQMSAAEKETLEKRNAELDKTIEDAWVDAKRAADARLQALVAAAQRRREETDSDAERYHLEYHDKIESLEQSHKDEVEEVRKYKNGLDKVVAIRFEKELREARKASLERENVDRGSYQAYHQIWDDIGAAARELSNEAKQATFQLNFQYRRWKKRLDSFDGERIHRRFPIRHPNLNARIKLFLQRKYEQSISLAESFAAVRFEMHDERSNLSSHAHYSRAMTRYHVFEETTKYMTASMAGTVLNEHPLQKMYSIVDQEIYNAEQQMEHDPSARESLKHKWKLDIKKRIMLSHILGFFARFREQDTLETLKRESLAEKDIFVATGKARELLEKAWEKWNDVKEVKDLTATERSEVTYKQQRSDRDEFRQRYGTAREEREHFISHMRKRHYLQSHLGKAVNVEEAQLDAVIDERLTEAKSATHQALENLIGGSVGRTRRPTAFARPSISPSPTAFVRATSSPLSPVRQNKSTTGSIGELQVKIRSLRTKLDQSESYSNDEERQKDQRELLETIAAHQRQTLANVRQNRAKALQEADNVRVQSLDREIARLSLALGNGTTSKETDGLGIAAYQPFAVVDSSNDGATSTPKSLPMRVRKRRSTRIRKTDLNPAKAPSLGGNESETTDISAEATEKQAEREGGMKHMYFRPTPSTQAPHSFWQGKSHRSQPDIAKAHWSSEAVAMATSSDEGYGPFRDLSLSQALRHPSLMASRASATSSAHVDADVDDLSDCSFSDGSVSELPSDSDESYAVSQDDMDSDSNFEVVPSPVQQSQSSSLTEDTFSTPSDDPLDSVIQPADEIEPDVELTYNIPAEDYRAAILSSKSSNAAFWNCKLYKNAEGKPPTVYYCTNFDTTEARAKEFLNEPVIGFDIEWEMYATLEKSGIKQNVSLIQIAAEDKVGLFHLALFHGDTADKLIPPSLRALLESKEIAKAGVNVQGDARRLSRCLGVEMAGLFELSHLYRVVQFSTSMPQQVNRKLFGLAAQVQEILGLPLKKDEVRTSAWSKRLQVEQTDYAASDAYAGFRLFHALEAKRKKMFPVPPRPGFYEEGLPLVLGNGQVVAPSRDSKRKRDVVDESGRKEEGEDDECEEFFDAVEQFDAESSDSSQRSSHDGGGVEYLTLPATEALSDSAEHEPPPTAVADAAEPPKSHPKRSFPSSTPEVALADTWAHTYRASLPPTYNLRVGHATLRAYHLWHTQRLSCAQVAALLRDPPLALQTVASYVLQAVKEEGLPSEEARVREVVAFLPGSVRGRYRGVKGVS